MLKGFCIDSFCFGAANGKTIGEHTTLAFRIQFCKTAAV